MDKIKVNENARFNERNGTQIAPRGRSTEEISFECHTIGFFYPDSQERDILLPSSSASLVHTAGNALTEKAWEDTVQELSYIRHSKRITIKPHTIPVDQKEPKRWK